MRSLEIYKICMKLLFSIYILPGTIFTWFLYMFPSGGYSAVRMTARWFRSDVMKFFMSTFFYYILLTSELSPENQNTYDKENNNQKHISKEVNPNTPKISKNNNTYIKKININDIKKSSGAILCLMLTDKYTLDDTETFSIINELKNRNAMCDGSKVIYFN